MGLPPYLSESVGQRGVHSGGFLSVEDCSLDVDHRLDHHGILYSDEHDRSVERPHGVEQILPR